MTSSTPDPKGARKWLREYLEIAGTDFNEHLENFARGNVGINNFQQSFEYCRVGPGYDIPVIPAGYLSLVARWDPVVLEFVKYVIAVNLRAHLPIPDLWNELHADIVEATVTRNPAKKGGRAKYPYRDALLAGLSDYVATTFNLRTYSNSASRKGQTAIEIVHAELVKAVPTHFGMISLCAVEKAVKRQMSKSP